MGQLLVVDDEIHIARVVQILFERNGWTVMPAADLAEADRLLKESAFDAILLDLKLPDGSGLDFLIKLRESEETRDIAVVVLSGAGFEDVSEHVRDLGGEYVSKPFSPSKLFHMVSSMVDSAGETQ